MRKILDLLNQQSCILLLRNGFKNFQQKLSGRGQREDKKEKTFGLAGQCSFPSTMR